MGSGCFSPVTNGVVLAEPSAGRCFSSPKFSEQRGFIILRKEIRHRRTGNSMSMADFINL